MDNKWTYYEIRRPNGKLAGRFRYDHANNDKAQVLGPDGWFDDKYRSLLDKIVKGEPDLDRLDGTPDWAYDAQGKLIP